MTMVDITYRGMAPSPALNDWIERWAERLHRAFDRIEHCAVVLEIPHRHHRHGRTFQVHVQVTVPQATVAITRDPGHDQGHESAYVAVADAFRAARRQLQDRARIRRGDVKFHALEG
jgi:ribosome-associated translation inhibitor RaiA